MSVGETANDLALTDAAEILNVHYMTAYRYVRMGLLRGHKVGAFWYVTRTDLKEFQSGRGNGVARIPTGGGHAKAPWSERLLARLIDGDEIGALGVMESALRSGTTMDRLYLDVLAPALVEIGERWRRGELEVYVEHRASVIAFRLIAQIGPRFIPRGVRKGEIIIGAPANERHGLASAMVADIMRGQGWQVSDLGADVPTSTFVGAVNDAVDLVAVCVVVTMPESLVAGGELLAALRSARRPGVPLYLGGAGVKSREEALNLGADRWVDSVESFIESCSVIARRQGVT